MRIQILKIGNYRIYNIFEMLEERNIKVLKPSVDKSFSGMSTVIEEKIGVIVFNNTTEIPLVRKRFTMLHELGHLFLDLSSFNEKRVNVYVISLPERCCSQKKVLAYFGGKRVKVYTNELKMIKQYFGISIPAIMYRAKAFDLISDS